MTPTRSDIAEIEDILRRLYDFKLRLERIESGNVYGPQPYPAGIPCVCGQFKRGETTGGWYCPVHGQQL